MKNRALLAIAFAVLIAFPLTIASFDNDVIRSVTAVEAISLYHTASPECTDKV